MSFLFHKRTKQAISWIWGVIAIIIIFSMILAYSGGLSSIFVPKTASTLATPRVKAISVATTSDVTIKRSTLDGSSSTTLSTVTIPTKLNPTTAAPSVDFGPNAIP